MSYERRERQNCERQSVDGRSNIMVGFARSNISRHATQAITIFKATPTTELGYNFSKEIVGVSSVVGVALKVTVAKVPLELTNSSDEHLEVGDELVSVNGVAKKSELINELRRAHGAIEIFVQRPDRGVLKVPSRDAPGVQHVGNAEPDSEELTQLGGGHLTAHVRELELHAPFTHNWFAMTDSLVRIATVRDFLEQRRPPRTKGSTSIWESNDDIIVRLIVEEGKMSICLRLMQAFRAELRSRLLLARLALEQAEQRLLSFERCLGSLIGECLEHIEVVQTCDLHLLLGHCADVLSSADAELHGGLHDRVLYGRRPADELTDEAHHESVAGLEHSQLSWVPRYLCSLLTHAEALGEDRLMGLLQQYQLVNLICDHLSKSYNHLDHQSRLASATFLAIALDTEASWTSSADFLSTKSLSLLKDMQEKFTGLAPAGSEQRRRLRPLLDTIAR